MTNPFDAAIELINEERLRLAKLCDGLENAERLTYTLDAIDRLWSARRVLEAAGKVDKERFIEGIDEANQFGRLHRNVMSGYGLFIEDLEAIAAALPDKVTP